MTYNTINRDSGFTVEIEYDNDPINPCKEYDNVGTVVLFNRCQYNFGNETASLEELQAIAKNPDNIAVQIYMYDHSEITINTTGFSCPWDSGVVGLIYCTKKKAVQEWGKKLCTKKVIAKAMACMRAEVDTLDQYLTGQVYGFVITDPDGDEVDSCWGFFGDEYCEEEALSSVKYHESKWFEDKAEQAEMACRDVRTI